MAAEPTQDELIAAAHNAGNYPAPGMNLFQRINAVKSEIAYVQKTKAVSTGGEGSYKAVTHDVVAAITRKPFMDHGVVSFASLVSSVMNAPDEGKKQRRYDALFDVTFVNVDDPSDRQVMRIEAHAMDSGDKAPGKALSYAKKYAILKLLDLESGEDEESRYAEFPAEEWETALLEAETLNDLKTLYETGYKAAEKANDTNAMKCIIKAKNIRGKALTKSEKPSLGEQA